MINLICEKCGSDDIIFDASGIWNIHEQDYDFEVDSAYCQQCKDIVPIKEIKINNENSTF